MKNAIKKITPNFLLNAYHFLLSFLGAVFYGFPSRKLKIIGVTGTNGKSTVVFLINQILEKTGRKTASASSIYFTIGGDVQPNNLKMTMPGRFKMQKFLRQAVRVGCQYAILEITSEGIKQHRHRFIGFDTAVLTNLTPEHLENHGGFENYKKAKGGLFQALKSNGKSIINLDDPNADYFLRFAAKEKWGYAIESKSIALKADLFAKIKGLALPNDNAWFVSVKRNLDGKARPFISAKTEFNLNLLGKFNAYNALAATAVGLTEKISLREIRMALEEAKGIPGRMEIVIKEQFTAIVDYAHTPDALEKVYQTVKGISDGKLIGVLGSAGGGRDKWKRPEMGEIADKYLDKIIITNEDPYDEDPQTIVDEISVGIKEKQVEKIIDRKEAIHRALKIAQKGDVVIITGKGCEPWMCVAGNKKIPWDDREIVRETLLSFRA